MPKSVGANCVRPRNFKTHTKQPSFAKSIIRQQARACHKPIIRLQADACRETTGLPYGYIVIFTLKSVGANCVRPRNLHKTAVLHKLIDPLQADACHKPNICQRVLPAAKPIIRRGAFPARQKGTIEMKHRTLTLIAILTLTLIFSALCLSACGGESPKPIKLADIEDINKIYAGSYTPPVTIPLSDYVNENGCQVVYYITTSDASVASATAENGTLTVNFHKADASADIAVSVKTGDTEAFALNFKVNTKSISKIACIGDSLTYGHTWTNQAYPVFLSEMVDDYGWEVKNFGLNGASITGTNPNLYLKYTEQKQYTDSLDYDADVVVIMLGTNDSKDWKAAEPNFESWYIELIESYQEKNPDVEIILVTAPPTLENNKFNLPNNVIKEKVCPIQRDVAEELGLPMIDFRQICEEYKGGYESLLRTDAAFDGVHLSFDGAVLLADLIRDEILKL
ncbi:MAG: hypothetical protein E7634_05925 [Ruminococcaceae bacterium]|nr:hypothetical protein [Oscillospiraceae bacterium]